MTVPDDIAWPLVLAVVVTHNGRRWLPGCLKSLALQSYAALEVVVVDAASEDMESVPRLVQRLLPDASILRLDNNVGFGAAANRALERAPAAREAEYYLFLHDDVALERDCVGMLVASALETDAGVVGGKGLSWDEPEVLLEVGMSADEFGYPVSGLEEGEIDQGQHDTRREVLFVTSACILVSRAAVERIGSWDSEYFLFGEDLDLCIRARMCGLPVVVTPKAQFYHAVAMATGRREGPPRDSVRYYTRRNRLRTIAKNASASRVLLLVALYTGVLAAEVVLLAALRRFEEIPPYLKAYGWFAGSMPDVARRRRAVQRRRQVSDRRVRRYMVRDLPRARIFLERRLLHWGEETMRLGARTFSAFTPSAIAARVSRWATSPASLVALAIAATLVVAARHILVGGTIGAGSLWPFPTETHRLLADYLARWRETGLGTAGAPAPALPLMWLVAIVSFGNAVVAQKVLVALLLAIGLFGMHRFVRRRTHFVPARMVAVGIYALAPVLRLGLVTGDLGALALYAFGPIILGTGLRMIGPAPGADGPRPPVPYTVDAMSRQAIRAALLSALAVALAPSALLAILAFWLAAGAHGVLEGRLSLEPLHRLGWLLASVVAAVVLLVPWSLEALRPSGAIAGPLFGGAGGGTAFRGLWSQVSLARVLVLSPGMPALAGVATIAVLGGALLIPSPSRRREARLLAGVVVVFGFWAGLVAKGWLPAPVVSPALWLVFPLVAVAVAGGHLIAGLSEDLPRHAAGWRHPVGLGAAIVLGIAVVGAWIPSLLGWESPRPSPVAGTGPEAAAVAAVHGSEQAKGEFRVLWLGQRFVDPIRSGLGPRASVPYVLTGAEGLSALDTAPPPPGPGEEWLSKNVDAILAARTHLAGHLLAPAGIRYVIVDRGDPATLGAIARQRDLALGQELAQLDIYENLNALPIATVPPPALAPAAASATADPMQLLEAQWSSVPTGPSTVTATATAEATGAFRRLSQGAFIGEVSTTDPRLLLLGETYSPGWNATVGGKPLKHAEAFGWSNRFAVPPGVGGPVRISLSGEWIRILWVVLQGALVVLALAMATVSRSQRAGPLSSPPAPGPPVPPGPKARTEGVAGSRTVRIIPKGPARMPGALGRGREGRPGSPVRPSSPPTPPGPPPGTPGTPGTPGRPGTPGTPPSGLSRPARQPRPSPDKPFPRPSPDKPFPTPSPEQRFTRPDRSGGVPTPPPGRRSPAPPTPPPDRNPPGPPDPPRRDDT